MTDEWLELLKTTAALEKTFIVSSVELRKDSERPADALALEEVEGVWVAVKAAAGEKCERCWIIDPSVGQSSDHPTLCRRCSAVVE